MGKVSLADMRAYLGRSLRSLNANKLNGLLAEVAMREHIATLGFGGNISPGGWIFRSVREGRFAKTAFVAFPADIQPDVDYSTVADLPAPGGGVNAVCSHFHQAGISAFACAALIPPSNAADSVVWYAKQLGVPQEKNWAPLLDQFADLFTPRVRRHNFLANKTATSAIPDAAVPGEFSKENLRVAVQSQFFSEVTDVDGVFYGTSIAYPVEVKEKTLADDKDTGPYFGLDAGPFAKLAYFAANRDGNMHSLFVVRQISDVTERAEVGWWFIRFQDLAKVASWVPRGGGKSMTGSRSVVIRVPLSAFTPLTAASLGAL